MPGVTKHGLDNMRLNTEAIVHRRGERAPKIMKAPIENRGAPGSHTRVEIALAATPILPATIAKAEDEVALITVSLNPPRLLLQDGECRRREWNFVRSPVFGARAVQPDKGSVEVDFRPAQACDFVAPTSCKN